MIFYQGRDVVLPVKNVQLWSAATNGYVAGTGSGVLTYSLVDAVTNTVIASGSGSLIPGQTNNWYVAIAASTWASSTRGTLTLLYTESGAHGSVGFPIQFLPPNQQAV